MEGFVVSDPSSCTELFCGKKVISREAFRNYYKEVKGKRKIGLLLTVNSKYYGELYPALMYLKEDLYMPKQLYMQYAYEHCGNVISGEGIELSIPIIDYCKGISCYGCTAGAPVAEKKKYEFPQFKRDIYDMYHILGDKVNRINLTGGDVFLHPNLAEMTEEIRKLYPEAFISFSVNGIGFDQQEDSLWKRLGECGVTLFWTLYPISYPDYGDTFEKIKRLGKGRIIIYVQGDSGGEGKSSWKIPFNRKKKSEKHDWLFCRLHKDSHNMLILRDGTVRTCFAVRLRDNLERRFEDKIGEALKDNRGEKGNYMKIADIHSSEEILNFMRKRIPLCDYCALRERHSMGKWMPSRREISEWIIEE